MQSLIFYTHTHTCNPCGIIDSSFSLIPNLFNNKQDFLRYFLTTKSNQKPLGCSSNGQDLKRHKAAAYLQATKAPDKSRIKKYLFLRLD